MEMTVCCKASELGVAAANFHKRLLRSGIEEREARTAARHVALSAATAANE